MMIIQNDKIWRHQKLRLKIRIFHGYLETLWDYLPHEFRVYDKIDLDIYTKKSNLSNTKL